MSDVLNESHGTSHQDKVASDIWYYLISFFILSGE
jgi:hypothetical protein